MDEELLCLCVCVEVGSTGSSERQAEDLRFGGGRVCGVWSVS